MSAPHHGWSEKRFENVIGMMLRVGVILAAAIVLLGGVLYLQQYGAVEPDYRLISRQRPATCGPCMRFSAMPL